MFEEVTGTLFTGDLFTHLGNGEAPEARESAFGKKSHAVTRESIVPAAIAAEEAFHSTSLAPAIGGTIRRLATLKPARLAVMHGSCFEGDCAAELNALADYYERALSAALKAA